MERTKHEKGNYACVWAFVCVRVWPALRQCVTIKKQEARKQDGSLSEVFGREGEPLPLIHNLCA